MRRCAELINLKNWFYYLPHPQGRKYRSGGINSFSSSTAAATGAALTSTFTVGDFGDQNKPLFIFAVYHEGENFERWEGLYRLCRYSRKRAKLAELLTRD